MTSNVGLYNCLDKTPLERGINSISKDTRVEYTKAYNNEFEYFIFCGDGMGDFEKRSTEADIDLVKDYVKYCREQIKLAKEYIAIKKKRGVGR